MGERSIDRSIVGCVGSLGSSVARHAGGSNDCIKSESIVESIVEMDTINVPLFVLNAV